MQEQHKGQHSGAKKEGSLYVVATPIGNLGDITLRALEILKQVDIVAAEDTRLTGNLLKHFCVGAKLLSVREHNELAGAQKILEALRAGLSVALVTDAGTPGISDPGARAVAAVRAGGGHIVPIPGPSAFAAALSIAGLESPQCLFYGFLPPKTGERRTALATLETLPYTLIFYEAPHRILDTVADLYAVFGANRTLVFARELTKTFEQIHVCPLVDAQAWLEADAQRQRGEFVLLLSAAIVTKDNHEGERVLRLLLDVLPASQAVKLAAQISGVKKNTLYELALQIQKA